MDGTQWPTERMQQENVNTGQGHRYPDKHTEQGRLRVPLAVRIQPNRKGPVRNSDD